MTDFCDRSIELQSDISDPYVLFCRAIFNERFLPKPEEKKKELDDLYHRMAKKAYELDSGNPEAVIMLSRSHMIKGERDKREELLKKALEINPNYALANFDLAMSFQFKSKFQDSLDSINKALELDPSDAARFQSMLPFCYIGLKDFEKAIEWCDTLIELFPDNFSRWGFKAASLAHLGRIEEGRAALDKYLENRNEIKTLADYEKVAPDSIKDLLLEGLKKLGLS